ncbi:MAG: phosphopantetheine-binding protein [Myxococcales bacterium]
MMSIHYRESVVQTLARHLGVQASEIALTHDLYRDWGLTPLSLVVVLLDLERSVAIELPPEELVSVRTVADLATRFRAWVRASIGAEPVTVRRTRRARVSRKAQSERRLRRELHHLRWLERERAPSNVRSLDAGRMRHSGAARRVASR